MPKWLDNAVFYEIYPQSFLDTNADGIGDFQGIINKLGYIGSWAAMRCGSIPAFCRPSATRGMMWRIITASRPGTARMRI